MGKNNRSDDFVDNLTVPPRLGNFDEYAVPEGNAIEKAQTAAHILRVKIASTVELREQNRAKIREYEHANDELSLVLDRFTATTD